MSMPPLYRTPRCTISVDHLLELLHWEGPDRFACWLRLENAWLFGEWIHTFASRAGRLFLELQVQRTSELERAVLLQLFRRDGDDTLDDGLHVLGLQSARLGDGTVSLRCGHDTTAGRFHCLHGLHRFHWRHFEEQSMRWVGVEMIV